MNLVIEKLLNHIDYLSDHIKGEPNASDLAELKQAKLDTMSELAFVIKDLLAYRKWKRQVNFYLIKKCNSVADDLPDYCYRDDYDNKVTPERCASRAIRSAKNTF